MLVEMNEPVADFEWGGLKVENDTGCFGRVSVHDERADPCTEQLAARYCIARVARMPL